MNKNMENTKTSKTQNTYKGAIGESIAEGFLVNKGYDIIERNYKNKIGEIDLIARHNNRIVFIEVKSRATAQFGYPREAVNFKKQQKIRRVAEVFLKSKGLLDSFVRFDVVEILAGEITHLESAF